MRLSFNLAVIQLGLVQRAETRVPKIKNESAVMRDPLPDEYRGWNSGAIVQAYFGALVSTLGPRTIQLSICQE